MSRAIKLRAWIVSENVMNQVNFLKEHNLGWYFANNGTACHLMQFTGIRDKSERGQEIYEGDIIQNANGVWVVEFINTFGSFYTVAGNQLQPLSMCKRSNNVIGNIYANPDLIPKEDKK